MTETGKAKLEKILFLKKTPRPSGGSVCGGETAEDEWCYIPSCIRNQQEISTFSYFFALFRISQILRQLTY